MPNNVADATCLERQQKMRSEIYSATMPRWVLFLAGGLIFSTLTFLGGYVLANANGISVLRVQSGYQMERLEELREEQKVQGAVLRALDKRGNGG